MTVADIVGEPLRLHRIGTRETRRERVDELLDQVGLAPEVARRYPHELSGGQRQRVSLARALSAGPSLLVADEPTSALDVSVQASVLNLIGRLQPDLGFACLFITHDLAAVEFLAQRVAVMYLGVLVEVAERAEPLRRARATRTPRRCCRRRRSRTRCCSAPGRRIVLSGEVPSPVDPPSGCRFHPRCPVAVPSSARESCRRCARSGPPANSWPATWSRTTARAPGWSTRARSPGIRGRADPQRRRHCMNPTRPQLAGTFGMVASTHWLASAAGMAVAGGGRQRLRRRRRGRVRAAGRGAAPQRPRRRGAAHLRPADDAAPDRPVWTGPGARGGHDRRTTVTSASTLIPGAGPLAAAVPGAVDAWLTLLRDHGTRRLGDVLQLRDLRTPSAGTRCCRGAVETIGRVARALRARTGPRRPSSICPAGPPPAAATCFATRRSPAPTGGSSTPRRPPAATVRPASRRPARPGGRASSPRRSTPSPGGRSCTPGSAGTPGVITGDDLAAFTATYEEPVSHSVPRRRRVQDAGRGGRGPCCCSNWRCSTDFDDDDDRPAHGAGSAHRGGGGEAGVRRPGGLVRRRAHAADGRPARPRLHRRAPAPWSATRRASSCDRARRTGAYRDCPPCSRGCARRVRRRGAGLGEPTSRPDRRRARRHLPSGRGRPVGQHRLGHARAVAGCRARRSSRRWASRWAVGCRCAGSRRACRRASCRAGGHGPR